MLNNISITAFNNWIRFTSCGIFLVSLTQTSYCTEDSCKSSAWNLLAGAIGVLSGGAALTWLANPLLFISWFCIYSNAKLSLQTSIAATLTALSFLFFTKVMVDEAGHYSKITTYNWGYWLWICSAVVMLGGNVYSKMILINKQMNS